MEKSFDITCDFCTELNNIHCDNNIFDTVLSETALTSRIILESTHFVLIPTIGAIVEGYVLIVSKKHYYSMGCIPDDYFNELVCFISQTKKLLSNQYKKRIICFEHGGSACSAKLGSCVDHAHLHLLPFDGDLNKLLQPYDLSIRQLSSLRVLQEYGLSNSPYLYWQNSDGDQYVVDNGIIPSQFFRKIVASYYGIPDLWDWHRYPFVNQMMKTYNNLRR